MVIVSSGAAASLSPIALLGSLRFFDADESIIVLVQLPKLGLLAQKLFRGDVSISIAIHPLKPLGTVLRGRRSSFSGIGIDCRRARIPQSSREMSTILLSHFTD